MNKLCLVFVGVFLIALHLTSQVQAQNTTMALPTTMAGNTTMLYHNTTGNSTKDKSSGGRTEVSVLLMVALAFLHGWS